jgi:tRNA(Ile)-lysidine synthase
MTAISPSEFSRLMAPFGPFESQPILLIATSGGPDSLALALLAHQWAKSQGGKAIAITVDHLLREDSTTEAQQVSEWLEARGMEHHILTWLRDHETETPKTAIQAAAREARYRLLGQWCKDHKVKHLLTAHHAQDQLETFLIRLTKGSGLKGLTSTQGIVNTRFGRILRPLLEVDPNRLKATLKQFNQPYLLDPSNENEDFTRVRWRQLIPSLASEGLTPQALQESLDRLSHAQCLIDQHISTLIRLYMTLSPYGYGILKKNALNESLEAFEEILKRALATIGTRTYPVRRQALHRAMESLKSGHSITLGGCQIVEKATEWWIVREPAAIRKDVLVNEPGTYLWDDRFTVDVAEVPCRVSALGENGIQMMSREQKEGVKKIPHVVLQTLPALWRGYEVLDPSPAFTFAPHSPLFPFESI